MYQSWLCRGAIKYWRITGMDSSVMKRMIRIRVIVQHIAEQKKVVVEMVDKNFDILNCGYFENIFIYVLEGRCADLCRSFYSFFRF